MIRSGTTMCGWGGSRRCQGRKKWRSRRRRRNRQGHRGGNHWLRQRWKAGGRGPLETALETFLAGLAAQARFNARPVLLPTAITDEVTQGQHGVNVGTGPMHPCSLQTSFDHDFVSTFHGATADGESLLQKEMVLHLCPAFFQIGQGFGQFERLSIRVSVDQTVQFNQELVRPCMLELV
jgi:hypothetical protein